MFRECVYNGRVMCKRVSKNRCTKVMHNECIKQGYMYLAGFWEARFVRIKPGFVQDVGLVNKNGDSSKAGCVYKPGMGIKVGMCIQARDMFTRLGVYTKQKYVDEAGCAYTGICVGSQIMYVNKICLYVRGDTIYTLPSHVVPDCSVVVALCITPFLSDHQRPAVFVLIFAQTPH